MKNMKARVWVAAADAQFSRSSYLFRSALCGSRESMGPREYFLTKLTSFAYTAPVSYAESVIDADTVSKTNTVTCPNRIKLSSMGFDHAF